MRQYHLFTKKWPLPHHACEQLCLSNTPLLYPIMISLVTSEPVYLCNVPNRHCWAFHNFPSVFLPMLFLPNWCLTCCWHQIQNQSTDIGVALHIMACKLNIYIWHFTVKIFNDIKIFLDTKNEKWHTEKNSEILTYPNSKHPRMTQRAQMEQREQKERTQSLSLFKAKNTCRSEHILDLFLKNDLYCPQRIPSYIEE